MLVVGVNDSSLRYSHGPSQLAWAVLSYSARGYDSAVCCNKMSCHAFPSEAFYEADKALEKILRKFAAVPRECACSQDGTR